MLQRGLREKIGFEILEKGIVKSQKEAAEAVDILYSTVNHRKVRRLWTKLISENQLKKRTINSVDESFTKMRTRKKDE